jgi:hypothetical protein
MLPRDLLGEIQQVLIDSDGYELPTLPGTSVAELPAAEPAQAEILLRVPASPDRCLQCHRPIPSGRWCQVRSGVYYCLPCALELVRRRKAEFSRVDASQLSENRLSTDIEK